MNDFNYYAPTKVVFGKGAEQKVGNLIKEQNCKKVLIHYGSGSARRSGLLDRIEAIFDKEGITYVELGGVVPNPRLSLVYEGIALCKKENVDFILAVGGGSVIDCCKVISAQALIPQRRSDMVLQMKETCGISLILNGNRLHVCRSV